MIYLLTFISVSQSKRKTSRTLRVNELDNVRLQCAATGNPTPIIVWSRSDSKVMDWGNWKDNSKIGQSINITKINRVNFFIIILREIVTK